jgi:hypothetical protein
MLQRIVNHGRRTIHRLIQSREIPALMPGSRDIVEDHKISAFSLKVNARRQANRSALGHACRDFVEHGGTLSSSPVNGLPAAFIF